MSWQDEEKKRRESITKQTASFETNNAIRSQKAEEFWARLIAANNALDPALRLNVGYHCCSGDNHAEVMAIWKDCSRHIYHGGGISLSEERIYDRTFGIVFDISKNAFIAEEIPRGDKKIRYIVDENSIDLLLRNLCTSRHLLTGFVPIK